MKRLLLLTATAALLAACAPFQETYYLDKEFGKDSRAAWDAQIINKDHRYAEQVPEGMAGITAEEAINVRNKMFAEAPQKSQACDLGMGSK